MDILIPDKWLREFLKTNASPRDIAKYLTLCGPSVEKTEGSRESIVYSIEVTTNRVDSASVYGIAREAYAILPRFGIKASLVDILRNKNFKYSPKVKYLNVSVDTKLCPRFTAVLIKNVKIDESFDWIKKRLELVGLRPINNVVDISNYVMHELGQPVHTFDYDKIKNAKMILRESRKGEELVTLDGEKLTLPGGDIVIEDGERRLIDLAGIMGGENSAVDNNTKNVLLFVQTYNPVNIRRTSMTLPKRTEASALFEKNLDTELVSLGIIRGAELFEKLTGGSAENEVLDIYNNPYKEKKVKTTLQFIEERLGIILDKDEIIRLLSALGFRVGWESQELILTVPSFRANDINIPEDIVEEVARIYGYHNLPSFLMPGQIPEPLESSPFELETKIKNTIKGLEGNEVYTLSLVSQEESGKNALKLKNPLGKEGEYLRTSIMPSLINAAKVNSGEKDPFHIFEISNIYLPRNNNLPEEKKVLAGIFSGYSFRDAKGVVEALLEDLNITINFLPEDYLHFTPSKRVIINVNRQKIGEFGELENSKYLYYEFDFKLLQNFYKSFPTFRQLPKYPPQIEDITLVLPEKTKVGDVIQSIEDTDKRISQVELTDIFNNSYTFRVWYQDPGKTLDNEEVEKIREKIFKLLSRSGVKIKY